MKEKISRFAKEIFEYDRPKLVVSEEKLYLEVEEQKKGQAVFHVSNQDNCNMKGIIYADDVNMTFDNNTFVGKEADITVTYNAVSDGTMGNVKNGNIVMVTDLGEYYLPYEIHIEQPYFSSSMGKIRDLHRFTNLAKENLHEALLIFKSPEFRTVILNKESDKRIYDGLIKNVNSVLALEEFLAGVRQKNEVHFLVEETEKEFNQVEDSFEENVLIKSSDWGHKELTVESDAKWLVPEVKKLSTEKFVNGEYSFKYSVDYDRLPALKNEAHITFSNERQDITVTIRVSKAAADHVQVKDSTYMKEKKLLAARVKAYMKFRLEKITREQYIDELEAILNSLSSLSPSLEHKLWYVHLYMVERKIDDVARIMETFMQEEQSLLEESVSYYLAYQYLKVLYTKKEEDIEAATRLIRSYYEEEMADWHLLWYLLYLDKDLEDNPKERINALYVELNRGVTSPVLYYEAVACLNKEPSLLDSLGKLERRLIHWAIRNGAMSSELANQFVFLASRTKTFDRLLLQDLMAFYETSKSKECLQVIVRMLIIAQKSDNAYFKWYELGVENNLKITELYEYYMYSLSDSAKQSIDRAVLLYFVYNNHLPDAKKAMLYSYIVKNKETIDSIYRTYEPQMESFTKKMLAKRSVNKEMAVLYHHFITKDMIGEEQAKFLPYLLFSYELSCSNKKMKAVVIRQQELKEEATILLEDGNCTISKVTEDMTIFFMDETGNRYLLRDEYSLRRIFDKEEFIDACYEFNKNDLRLLLYRRKNAPDPAEQAFIINRLLETKEVSEEFKQSHIVKMIEYYYDQNDINKLDEYLFAIDFKEVEEKERHTVIDYLILRNIYDKAFDMIKQYGFIKANNKRIFSLVCYMLSKPYAKLRDDTLLNLCVFLWKQNMETKEMVTYLMEYYEQSTEELYHLYETAQKHNLEDLRFIERLIGQMLFSETMLDKSRSLYETFYPSGNNKLLARAYLNYMAYRFLMFEEPFDPMLGEMMKKESFYHESKVCMLAILKAYSKKTELNEEELKYVDYNLHKFISRGTVLKFFKDYEDRVVLTDDVANRYYVEYKASPKSRVTIFYTIDGMEKQCAEMKNMFEGIYVKDFLLFYGETLTYYIVEETKEKQIISKSVTIKQNEMCNPRSNRFYAVNELLKTYESGDKQALQEMLEQFAIEDYITSSLFTPL